MALPLSDPVGGLRMGYSFELPRYLASPILTSDQALTDFLKSVEKRAFKRTAFTVRDDDSALDIVQDAMIRLAERYADRPSQEWPLLFQRILANATMDWFRRQKVRNALFSSIEELESSDDDPAFDLLEYFATGGGGSGTESAEDGAYRSQVMMIIESEISELPARQREAFLLRYWEEMDVAETAQVMGCSEGSVKTHCSRAVNSLAKALKARGIVL
jgi:RNA polymerase sigma-70 factor (ECF subfamily)